MSIIQNGGYMADNQPEAPVASIKNTRAVFPRISLLKVLDLAKNIYELGEGDPVPRLIVFDRMNKSPDSGPSRMLVTTSNSYGLTSGSYKAERLKVTEAGKAMLSQNQATRFKAASKLLLSNDLFRQFYEKYVNRAIPPEAMAVDFLKQTGNLGEADAKAAHAVFVENLKSLGFVKEMSGRPTILPLDMLSNDDSEEIDEDADQGTPDAEGETEEDEAVQSKKKAKTTAQILPQFNFNIQIQLPDNGNAETYDAIFKSMSEHLLKNSGE